MANFLEMSPAVAGLVVSQICNMDSNRGVNSGDPVYGHPGTTGLFQGGTLQPSNVWSCAVIYIMQGTVPTDLSTLVNPQVRSSDQLIAFTTIPLTGQNPRGDFLPSNVSVNPVLIDTNYVASYAAGTATWFWLVIGPNSTTTAGVIGNTITHQVIGTVGVTGSGADLQMSSVNITVNESLKLTNFEIAFPTSWTY